MCKLALSEELSQLAPSKTTLLPLTIVGQNLHSFSERCNYLIFIFPEK